MEPRWANSRTSRAAARRLPWGFVWPLVAVLAACVPDLHIREERFEGLDTPSQYATYRWDETMLYEKKSEESVDTSFNALIRQSVDSALESRGYTRSNGDNAAMILSIQLTVNEKVEAFPAFNTTDPEDETISYGLLWRLPAGRSAKNLEHLSPTAEITFLTEGVLHIGAFSPRKEPIWHAMGHKVLEHSHSPEMHGAALQQAVKELMGRFPKSAVP